MGKGFYISKAAATGAGVVCAAAVVTIIALSVVYSQEKSKNNNLSVLPTAEGSTTQPTTKPPPTTVTATGTPPPTPSKPWDNYRLPKSLKPLFYNVTLWPRLTPDPVIGHFFFTGESTVNFQCDEDTDLILIHSHKLMYTTDYHMAILTENTSDVNVPMVKSTWLHNETQFMVIHVTRNLTKGNIYQLYTKFIGVLSDDLGGFYRSEYEENGMKKVVATTQMQATHARKVFPCFDEPAMKAVFYITILHDLDTIALSNSDVTVSEKVVIDGQTLEKTVFHPTKKMSTYLLAFVVSDFIFIGDSTDKLLVRVFARRSAIEAGQGEYALNTTRPILKFFETYYNSSYPLPKSDQIALPDFSAGAMENWGLITYRETALLYDDAFSSSSNKERIATIIAHELAHMWFGNLVTMNWWNDLWLNEGFASYVEYLGAHKAEPNWNVTDLIVLNDVHRVFAVDALASSHPLTSKEEDVQTPAQISELFDAISYSKGAAVLRMLSDFLTEEVFTKGLQTYLDEFKFETAVYTDLWKHLQMAVTVAGTQLPDTVNNIMNTWVLQMGFPVVTIDTRTGAISQKHFLLEPNSEVTAPSPFNYEWIIPIKWIKTGVTQPAQWLKAKSATIDAMKASGADWVLVNHNVVGYYRVNYDQDNWDKLLNALSTNHQVIPVINRAQIVDDAFNLARAQIISTVLALNTTKYLNNERDYMPWQSTLNNLDFFYLMFDRSEVYGPMQDYMRKQVTPLFLYYKGMTQNWIEVPAGHMDQYNQVTSISLACRSGVEECVSLTKQWFEVWMNTNINQIHPNLRYTVYCNAIAAGGAKEWDFAWEQFQKATIATEAEKLRSALACTKQPWLLNRYLTFTLNSTLIRKQDVSSTIVSIANNVVGQPLAWDFLRARWAYILTEYSGGLSSFNNLINGVTKRFSTQFELEQLKQFKIDNADVGFGAATMALDQSIERTIANIKWVEGNKKTVLDWFTDEAKLK